MVAKVIVYKRSQREYPHSIVKNISMQIPLYYDRNKNFWVQIQPKIYIEEYGTIPVFIFEVFIVFLWIELNSRLFWF